MTNSPELSCDPIKIHPIDWFGLCVFSRTQCSAPDTKQQMSHSRHKSDLPEFLIPTVCAITYKFHRVRCAWEIKINHVNPRDGWKGLKMFMETIPVVGYWKHDVYSLKFANFIQTQSILRDTNLRVVAFMSFNCACTPVWFSWSMDTAEYRFLIILLILSMPVQIQMCIHSWRQTVTQPCIKATSWLLTDTGSNHSWGTY